MKIYVAGPISSIPEYNFPEFFMVSDALRSMGHDVANPAENNGATLEEALRDAPYNPMTWEDYMRVDLRFVTHADALCVLPGWQNSRGARLEVKVAKELGIPLYIFRDGKLQPRIQVVGISGYARSGKDTVAARLVEHGYIRGSFADAIREALYRLNPMIGEESLQSKVDRLGWDTTKAIPEVRELLQRLGTEVGRDMFGDNIWIDYLLDSLPDGSKVVIPDVRYPNEADAITALGGQVWRIIRPGVTAVNSHVSDSAMDDYRFITRLHNDTTIDDLHTAVDFLLIPSSYSDPMAEPLFEELL